jgi:hypothetical protein
MRTSSTFERATNTMSVASNDFRLVRFSQAMHYCGQVGYGCVLLVDVDKGHLRREQSEDCGTLATQTLDNKQSLSPGYQ